MTDSDTPAPRILLRDARIAVASKPAGMLVHGGMGADRSETFLLQAVRDLVGCRVHAVHRIDRPASGLVLFALDPLGARALQDAWRGGLVAKSYRIAVRGWPGPDEGVRDEPLDDPETGIVREAVTRWKVLERILVPFPSGPHPRTRFSLVEVALDTGRWHQIRRHFARMGHPVVGDTTHGDRHVNHMLRERLGWWRLMLWACHLEFPHPDDGRRVAVDDVTENGITPFWDRLVAEASLSP